MARTKRKDHGLFDHPNLPQGPPRRTGKLRMISLVRGIWVLALAIITSVIAPGVAMADHTYLPWKIFKFTGSPAAGVQDRHDFTIDQDGALYFTLKSFTPGAEVPGWTPVLEIGFYPKNQSLCPFRYASTTKDPPGGTTFGPYYVAAGAYQSVYSLVGAATTGYELEIAYHPQLIPNDVELNDSPETAQNVGDIYPGEHMTGHLAYLEGGVSGCKHNKHDYIRFRMLSTGNYQVRIHYDPAFRDKPGCVVWFALHDDTASMWVLNHTGPADVTLRPIAFHAGRQYLVSMESSDGCYTMTFPPGYYSGVVADNKAGAYDIQIYDPSAPPPVTIRWGSVEKAAGNVPKGPNTM